MSTRRVWGASEARANFPSVIEGALTGPPQFIRKRSGEEVVVISRETYEKLRPNIKSFLLGSAGLDSDDVLANALRSVRRLGAAGFAPRARKKRA